MSVWHGFGPESRTFAGPGAPPPRLQPEAPGGILPVAARNSRLKVLIVDDEALICWAVAEGLIAAGYDVVTAAAAGQALGLIDEPTVRIDMALVDLRLPDGSGLTVLERLRERRGVPGVLMTAYAAPGIARDAEAAGALCVVVKPFDLGDIIRLVGNTLRDDAR